jgi:outer membrane lipoprotein-sorting protein
MDAGGKEDHTLPFVTKLKRPHKSRLEIVFKDQTALQVFDGTHGWKLRPFLNRNEVENFTPAEAKLAAATDELDGPLVDYAAKGTKVALAGKETVEGHPAYKLTLTLRGGEKRNVWVDAGTFLELKADGEPRILDGKPHAVSIFYRDYKAEHGLMVPHVLETEVVGVKQTHKIEVSKVAVNESLSDGLFNKPQLAATAATVPVPKRP